MKLSGLMVSVVAVALVLGLVGFILARSNTEYPISDFNESEYTEIQGKINETNQLTAEMQSKVLNITQQTGALDVVGFYFAGGYDTFRIGGRTVGIFSTLTYIMAAKIGVPGLIISSIISIILIALLVGFLIEKVIFKVP